MSELLADIRSRIEALGMDFQFMGTLKTNMNRIERETWLLEYEGSQFVFVAGQKNVTLGWDVAQCSLGEGVLKDLQEEFTEGHKYYQEEMEYLREHYQKEIGKANAAGDFAKAEELASEMDDELECLKEEMNNDGYMSWDDFMLKWNENLYQCLSPLRTVDIDDMIVEVDSRYLKEDADSLVQAIHSLKEAPFTLATENEWEYFCNGGTRTFFRWGDTLHDALTEIYKIGTDNGETSFVLNQPNMLGLFIAYDSYKNEIIDNTLYTKGGDGGCSLCGGDGAIYVLPCYTAFYRQPIDGHNHKLLKDFYSYRRVLRLP